MWCHEFLYHLGIVWLDTAFLVLFSVFCLKLTWGLCSLYVWSSSSPHFKWKTFINYVKTFILLKKMESCQQFNLYMENHNLIQRLVSSKFCSYLALRILIYFNCHLGVYFSFSCMSCSKYIRTQYSSLLKCHYNVKLNVIKASLYLCIFVFWFNLIYLIIFSIVFAKSVCKLLK